MPLFMVRREFYDAIMAETKTSEWRAGVKWQYLWTRRPPINEAMFMCGPRRHRRRVIEVHLHYRKSIIGSSLIPEEAMRIYPRAERFYEVRLGEIIGESVDSRSRS